MSAGGDAKLFARVSQKFQFSSNCSKLCRLFLIGPILYILNLFSLITVHLRVISSSIFAHPFTSEEEKFVVFKIRLTLLYHLTSSIHESEFDAEIDTVSDEQ